MTNHAVCNCADLKERTKTMSRHGNRRGQIAAFRDSFETINWLYLLFKCGIKTKTHFEWLLWHWSSLGQLNLEPTRPDGLVGCKVPTDLVKISVKEATHIGFYYINKHGLRSWTDKFDHFHICLFLAATKQLYKWYFPSVRLSVRPSVCPSVCLSHLFDYVPIIVSSWNFQELLPMTKVRSMQKVKVRGQRSRSQRSQPNLTISGL